MEKLGINMSDKHLSLYNVAIGNGFKKEVTRLGDSQSSSTEVAEMSYYGLWRAQQV